jgi:hypothetical protein
MRSAMTFEGQIPGIPGATVQLVERGTLPEHLSGGTQLGGWVEARPGQLLFSVPRLARFLVRDGEKISVDPAPDADPDAIELMVRGAGRGILIHQRGELALEAATLVAPDGRCVAISSFSGLGKSTVAAVLCGRSWKLVADDITRVTWDSDAATVWPSNSTLKLWRDACEKLNIDFEKLGRVRAGVDKYHVPFTAAEKPIRLDAIVKLRMGPQAHAALIRGMARASILPECTFRTRLLQPLGRALEHSRIASRVNDACRIVVLTGARTAPAEELADRIDEATR